MANSRKRKILALIPARGGSKRIPRKNIIDFCGKPMLAWPFEAARESGLFDTIHVSTEDAEILALAEKLGADVSMPRDAALADDVTPLLPLARWVLQAFDAQGRTFEDVFILFPCSPLLRAVDLIAAYELYQAHGRRRNLLTICRAPAYVEWYYRRTEHGALVPTTPGGAFIRSQELKPTYYETGTFTIFSREWLLNVDNLKDDTNYVGFELPPWRSVDIDEPADLEYAKVLFQFSRSAGHY
jgi:N-acylneuraminate cytidylyltransferase